MNEIIKKNGIMYGIILGVFSILVTTIIYAVNLELFVNPWIGMVSLAVYLIIGIMLIAKTKKQLNNQITFKEAFTVFFIAAVIGGTLSVIFNIILFNVVDPQSKETLQRLTLEYTMHFMEKMGAPSASINEAMEKMGDTDNYSPLNLLKGLLFGWIFSAILGLILALIFKNKTTHHD